MVMTAILKGNQRSHERPFDPWRRNNMHKRIVLVLLIAALLTAPLAAGEIGFVLDEFDVNGDFLFGFFPTFLTAGADYMGLELLDGQSTDLKFITGGGWTQRQLWRDAAGEVLSYTDSAAADADADMRTFNVITAEWKVLLEQGLFWSDTTYDDLITLQLGYLGRFESYLENKDGTDSYFFDSLSLVYQESDQLISNTLTMGVKLETSVSNMVSKRGMDLEVSADYAPQWLLNDALLESTVDYFSVKGVFTGYLPVYELLSDEYLNVVSVFLADRIRVDYVEGDAVPVYAQKKSSLGYKMRGFESYSYATSITAVNNFDVRVTGPEVLVPGLFPRAALYVDLGYYGGDYPGPAAQEDSGLLASAGAEVAFSIFDFLNFGIRGNYAFVGDTLTGSDFSYDIFMNMHY